MSSKDYQLIANAIATVRLLELNPSLQGLKITPTTTVDKVARYIGEALAEDNPRFDEDRFLKSCAEPRTYR